MSHAPRLLSWMLVAIAAGPPARAERPKVDVQAMQEALGPVNAEPAPGTGGQASASAYAHFLRSRLAHHDGDHRAALDELRLALATDPDNPLLMTQLAEEHARLSDLDRAEAQLKKVIERAPTYAPAQLLMGRVLAEAGKSTRARVHLAQAIRLTPRDPEPYLVLAQLNLEQGRTDEAVRVIEELGAALPGDPLGYRKLGLALAERREGPVAERLLRKAVERDPGDEEVWTALAVLAEQAGKLEEALEAHQHALARDPESREALLAAGRLALRLGDAPGAKAYFEKLRTVAAEPEVVVRVAFAYLSQNRLNLAAEVLDDARARLAEPRLHFYAGLVHERLKDCARAAEAFDAVSREVGDVYFEARAHRASCLSSLGQHRAAVDLLRRLAEEKPDLPGLVPTQVRVLERAGLHKEAEGALQRALGKGPTPEVVDALVGYHGRQGKPGQAVDVLTQALGQRPRDAALLFGLGVALEKRGDWGKALERMRQVLEVAPRHAPSLNFIGYTLAFRGGNLDDAERNVRRALELEPDSAAYLDSLGYVLLRRGEPERAVGLLEKAVEASPDEPTLLEHLADASALTGRKERAERCYRRALEVLAGAPEEAERPGQRADIEAKLKALLRG